MYSWFFSHSKTFFIVPIHMCGNHCLHCSVLSFISCMSCHRDVNFTIVCHASWYVSSGVFYILPFCSRRMLWLMVLKLRERSRRSNRDTLPILVFLCRRSAGHFRSIARPETWQCYQWLLFSLVLFSSYSFCFHFDACVLCCRHLWDLISCFGSRRSRFFVRGL